MKRMTKITSLLLSLLVVLAMSQMAFAETYPAAQGTYNFNGEEIVTEGSTQEISDQIKNLEPGDTVQITLHYNNDSDEDTEWYIRNDILKTLEEASDATNGGYTYKLTNYGVKNGKEVIFDSEAVGGDSGEGPEGIGEGLYGVDDAINSTDDEENDEDQWFHIDSMDAHQGGGRTVLEVGLDGESQINSYQLTDGALQIQYAVEVHENIVNEEHIPGKRIVKTGDETPVMLTVAIFLAAVVLLVLAIISFKKDRKDGDEA